MAVEARKPAPRQLNGPGVRDFWLRRAAGVRRLLVFAAAGLLLRLGSRIASGTPLAWQPPFQSGTRSSNVQEIATRNLVGRRAYAATLEARDLLLDFEVVEDFSGNGTAFALKPGSVPLEPPEDDAVQYHIDTFSPGFVVDRVLSQDACRKLVALSEAAGFTSRWSAQLGVVTLYIDEEFERKLFERIRHFLPDHVGGRPIGINRRWAVIKYGPGEYMNTHIDGHVPGTTRVGDKLEYEVGTRSYMTALFWLADDVVGGETVFTFPQGGTWVKIPPKEGAALFFNHGQNAVSNPYHHGGSVKSGVKYLVRADVIYSNE